MPRFPVGFVAHGAPYLAIDSVRGEPLRQWGQSVPKPKAFLVISAHYQDAPLTLGATENTELMYDFGGFPDALYHVKYPAPGAPWLADRIEQMLSGTPVHRSERALDHGVWTPLLHMAPSAEVPVLELSMPYSFTPEQLFDIGQRLSTLREEGVWILGSGNLVHNLRRIDWNDRQPPPSWASDFDSWIADVVNRGDWDSLLNYRALAPVPEVAHPTDDHLRPLFVAAGAAADDPAKFVLEGWEYGSISRRSVQFG